MKTDLDYTSEALENSRDELASLRHQLAEAESELATLRDQNSAGREELTKLRHVLAEAESSLATLRDQQPGVRDFADSLSRFVNDVMDSRFSGDTFEDKVRPVVEDIARDILENATVEIDSAWIRV